MSDSRAKRVLSEREALERIAEPLDCGCVPCRGQCRSQHALEIELEERQDIARAAIAKATVAFGREGV